MWILHSRIGRICKYGTTITALDRVGNEGRLLKIHANKRGIYVQMKSSECAHGKSHNFHGSWNKCVIFK